MAFSPFLREAEENLPTGWTIAALPEVTDFQEGPGILAKDFRETGVPLLRLRNVEGAFVNLEGSNFLDPRMVERKWDHFRLMPGDLLISTSATFGRVSVVTPEAEGSIAYTGLIRFRPTSRSLSHGYLRAFLGSELFRLQAESSASGSVIRHFGPSHIKQMAIILPPRAEQDAITGIHSGIENKIALLRETNATLEAIAQALFKSWFVDFDPVRAKAEGRDPVGVPPEVADLFPDVFDGSKLGQIPSTWSVEQLGNHLTVLETGRRPKGGVGDVSEGVPSIGAESIIRIGQFDYGKTKYVTHDFFDGMRSGKLVSRDVLLYKDGGKPGTFLPRVSMFGDGFPFETCGINEHVFRIRTGPCLSQAYLYFWLWSDIAMHELKHRGGKAAIPGINQADVREIPVLLPSAEVLAAFNEVADPAIARILSNAKEIRVLEELRDTLLPRLMSGKLRIQDVTA